MTRLDEATARSYRPSFRQLRFRFWRLAVLGGASADLFNNPQLLEQCYESLSIISFQQIAGTQQSAFWNSAGRDLGPWKRAPICDNRRGKRECARCAV